MSAWYAWHVTSAPDQLLLRHTRNRDRAQLRALVRLLFDFLPAGLFVAADRRGVLPGETVTADPPDAPDDAPDPVHQARLLRAPVRLTFSMDRLVHSPFDYADFGRPFTPSLLPSQTDLVLALSAEASPAAARPAPYLEEVVERAQAILTARGGKLRSRDIVRLALRLLRQRGIRPEQALGDVVAPDLGIADVAAGDVGRAMPGLLHDGGQIGAGQRRRGGQARP